MFLVMVDGAFFIKPVRARENPSQPPKFMIEECDGRHSWIFFLNRDESVWPSVEKENFRSVIIIDQNGIYWGC
jgi:hypothetical protein